MPLPSPPLLGAHTSIAGGIFNAIRIGAEIGADTIQIFSKSQLQWEGRRYGEKELERYFRLREETGISPSIIHDAYLINLGSPDADKLTRSRMAFIDEMQRAALLKVPYLLTHPGAHMGAGEAAGLRTIAESLRMAWETAATPDIMLLLECTAGQGSNLGYRFEHLRDIIAKSGIEAHLGVCIDTCHAFAAGYDLRTTESWEETMTTFDQVVGLANLKAFHLNDSAKPLGSRRDRHRRAGEGEIGLPAFEIILNDPRVSGLPMIQEIPGGPAADRRQIALFREMLNKSG